MSYYFLGGVGDAELYQNNTLILSAKSLTDEGFNLSVTEEAVRGGANNKFIGSYYHDSTFGVSLTDALWNLQYIALQVGSGINADTTNASLVTERITVGSGGLITVSATPHDWLGLGTIGWYKIDGSSEWHPITFTGSSVTVGALTAGTNVCVKYNKEGNVRQVVIPADFVPSIVTAVITIPLFMAASPDDIDVSHASKIGSVVVEVPRLQLDGNMDFSISSGGISGTAINGTARVVYSGGSCDDNGYYAIIKEVKNYGNWYDGLVRMAVDGAEKVMAKNSTETLKVYGQYADGSVGLIGNDKLTFAVSSGSSASVSNGVVTASSTAGDTMISVTVTAKQDVDAFVKITVQ